MHLALFWFVDSISGLIASFIAYGVLHLARRFDFFFFVVVLFPRGVRIRIENGFGYTNTMN